MGNKTTDLIVALVAIAIVLILLVGGVLWKQKSDADREILKLDLQVRELQRKLIDEMKNKSAENIPAQPEADAIK